MKLILPDVPVVRKLGAAELRLELACALYAQGKVTKVAGAELAETDFHTFQRALQERRICTGTVEGLRGDLEALDRLFTEGGTVPRNG